MKRERWKYYQLKSNGVSNTKWMPWEELPERFKNFISGDRSHREFSLKITTEDYTIVVEKEVQPVSQ